MKIRKAKKEDINKIVIVMLEIAKLHIKGRPDFFKEQSEKNMRENVIQKIIDNNSEILVAVNEKEITGILIYRLKKIEKHQNLKDAKILWIEEIGVKEGRKKEGIGKLLMEKAKEIAKKEKCERLELNCWCFNTNAIAFYEKIGMTKQRLNMEIKL